MESDISVSFFGKNNLAGTEEDLWDSQSSLPSCREPVCTSWLKINIDNNKMKLPCPQKITV